MADQDRAAPGQMVLFLLVPRFSMIAFAAAIEPLRLANRLAERELYRWRLLSVDGAPVAASNGIAVVPDGGLAECSSGRSATVLVCAGLGVERQHDPRIAAWLRRLDRQGVTLGALCTGAHVLARAGLLNGRRAAIHWENLPGFSEAFPEVEATSDLFEIDHDRYTCCGGTAALDMMLHLIAERHGPALAAKVSEQCMLDRVRGPHDRQRLPLRERLGIHHPKLIAAVELMEANVEEPLGQGEIANLVGVSRRQLERLFARHLGRTPAQYYLKTRLARARHLLYQTEMPVMDVALACGFVSPSHFATCYRQLYGRTPRTERATTHWIAGAP